MVTLGLVIALTLLVGPIIGWLSLAAVMYVANRMGGK